MIRLRDIYDWTCLGTGAGTHAMTGKTPPPAYQALVRQFCQTGGRSNDFLSRCIAQFRTKYALPPPNGVLGPLADELPGIVDSLNTRGYHVFSRTLSEDLCDRLLAMGLDQPSLVREDERDVSAAGSLRVYREDRSSPKGIRYDFPVATLLANPDVQELLCDPSILGVAQSYLGSLPMADVLTMWWNTAYSDRPSEAAAQFYHFDMDRIKWLKFFIYLTDVDTNNGPHTFIAGSHKSGGIPPSVLKKGYVRLTDEEVSKHYSPADFIEFTGKRGTVLAEDTRGLHKGKHVTQGDRLVLQLQFSNSLFGGHYPPATQPKFSAPECQAFVERYPEIFAAFLPRA